MVDAQ